MARSPDTAMPQFTLLLTDIVDSTLIGERLGEARASELFAEHDRRARDLLDRHRGREVDRTDGFLLVFDDSADAAGFALDYGRAIAELGLQARTGIHRGSLTLRENGPSDIARGARRFDVHGLGIPVVARVMALARAGQTLLSAPARAVLSPSLPKDAELESHGHYRLKGLEEPMEVFELGTRGSSRFTPPADVDKAYRVVREGDHWRPVREVRHNLSGERDAFVGRSAELRNLAIRLDDGARLVTVLGPGGTGKTRFVRRYGRIWLGDWPGGVYFCDLSESRSLDGIYYAVSRVLDVSLGKEDAGVQLGHAIAARGRCLVIVDNVEQVVQHAQATIGRWLDATRDASFLVTSRERLHLAGEECFPLEPLSVDAEAMDLFTTRARAQKPDFVIDQANRAAVGEVVRLLDGLPLAIELAAARIRVLSPFQLVERMRDRFGLLIGAHGAAARQSTLRAAIDWSWDLLAPWEQAALAQCSVFEGGFTLAAAEATLDLAAWPEAPTALDVVQALVDKNLFRTWMPMPASRRNDIDEPYFGMYISIREYAAEKLASGAVGSKESADARHGRYFATFGTDDALDALARHEGVKRRRALALELDNLVAACRRAVGRNDGATAIATYLAAWEVMAYRGPYALARELGAEVLAIDALDAHQRVAALTVQARAAMRGGRMDEAGTQLAEALTLACESRDTAGEAGALYLLGDLCRLQGRLTEAHERYESAAAVARHAGDRRIEGRVLESLGYVHRQQGHGDEARKHFDAALAIARDIGDRKEEGVVLGALGHLMTEQGVGEQARRNLEAAIDIAREVGDRGLEAVALANLGSWHYEQGRRDDAFEPFHAALAIHREMGNRRLEGIALGNLAALQSEQGRYDAARIDFAAALAIARAVGNRGHEGFMLLSLGIVQHEQGERDTARQTYQAALSLASDVGESRVESIVQRQLGVLFAEMDRIAEARTHLDRALELARRAGYLRLEGLTLAALGELLLRTGTMDEAFAALRSGESALRELGDGLELAKLLCIRGRADLVAGDRERARAMLAEAESHAAKVGQAGDAELSRGIAKLRKALA